MARFKGKVGYGYTNEEPPGSGKWVDEIVVRTYSGEVVKSVRRIEPGESVNDNIVLSEQISVVADAYAEQHFYAIRYIERAGVLWTVTSVEVKRPRLLLSLGEVYNGPTPEDP